MTPTPMIRVRQAGGINFNYSYSVERLADGLFFDFTSQAFVDPKVFAVAGSPARATSPLTEMSWPFQGCQCANLPTRTVAADGTATLAQFPDGSYATRIHLAGEHCQVVDIQIHYLKNGDDQPTAA